MKLLLASGNVLEGSPEELAAYEAAYEKLRGGVSVRERTARHIVQTAHARFVSPEEIRNAAKEAKNRGENFFDLDPLDALKRIRSNEQIDRTVYLRFYYYFNQMKKEVARE